jgi:hypothetical protein
LREAVGCPAYKRNAVLGERIVQPIREWIEGFLRGRYGYEGNKVYLALAGLVLIGVILTAVLLLTGPLLCIGALALLLLLLGVERPAKLAVVALLIAGSCAASLAVWMAYLSHGW